MREVLKNIDKFEVRQAYEGRSYCLRSSVSIARPRAEVFEFFANANNLQELTPDHLNFSIITPGPIEISEGSVIDYRLSLYGVSFGWQSEITVWEPPYRFVDEQRKGPYKYWIHEHVFVEDEGKTVVKDHLRYFPVGGALLNALFVKRDIGKIFNYRAQKLLQIFGSVE